MKICDITYCSSMDCENVECKRNIKNLLGADVLVSLCDFAETCGDFMDYEEHNNTETTK